MVEKKRGRDKKKLGKFLTIQLARGSGGVSTQYGSYG